MALTSLRSASTQLPAALDHLEALMRIDSTSGNEAAAIHYAAHIAAELGLKATLLPVGDGRDNLLVGHRQPEFVLCTHIDTVPPFIAPTRGSDHIAGRGACDAKGVAIAMLYAVQAVLEMKPEAPVACLLVVSEETDHSGAKAIARDRPIQPRHIILGEPCGMRPAVGQKGLLKLTLSVHGTAAHSAYPELGTSATHALVTALNALLLTPLPHDPILGESTLNIGLLEGGLAANVVAPSAEATLLIRCAAPVNAILSSIEDTLNRLPGAFTLQELSRSEPIDFHTLQSVPGAAVPFNTDASSLQSLGAQLSLMGPGDMRCAHSPHEVLSFTALQEGILRFSEALIRLLP